MLKFNLRRFIFFVLCARILFDIGKESCLNFMVLIFFVCFQSLKHVSKVLKFQNYEPVHFLYNAFSVALIDERAESNKKELYFKPEVSRCISLTVIKCIPAFFRDEFASRTSKKIQLR